MAHKQFKWQQNRVHSSSDCVECFRNTWIFLFSVKHLPDRPTLHMFAATKGKCPNVCWSKGTILTRFYYWNAILLSVVLVCWTFVRIHRKNLNIIWCTHFFFVQNTMAFFGIISNVIRYFNVLGRFCSMHFMSFNSIWIRIRAHILQDIFSIYLDNMRISGILYMTHTRNAISAEMSEKITRQKLMDVIEQ